MTEYVLSFKPAVSGYGSHDPSAALFDGAELVYAVEEERLNRRKHATGDFPKNAITACLEYSDITLSDLKKIVLPYRPRLESKNLRYDFKELRAMDSIPEQLYRLNERLVEHAVYRFYPTREVERALERHIGGILPPVETKPHHACHAASAFHPSGFDEALVVTLDGEGEFDSTVVWHGTVDGLERIRTYKTPNSLGHFYGAVTEFLGYRAFNGEGKVMGLAPYGEENAQLEAALRKAIDLGVDYDVTSITKYSKADGVANLEEILDRPSKDDTNSFTDWEKDLAYVAQKLIEDIVMDIVEEYCGDLDTSAVALAGGVALNCKMNKRVMELGCVDDLFIQPVAHDGGLAIGGGLLEQPPSAVDEMNTIYFGSEYTTESIRKLLKTNKLPYRVPENLEQTVASELAAGKLIGWFQGRMEMGPRALGNRSILADPRTEDSRDRVNEFVKHREKWRPFAPSILEEHAERYLQNAEPSPYMIKTFDTKPNSREKIKAVLHPGDNTTRPQTVREEQNPRYYRVIDEFETLTGVPVVLNTSFNDHGEPIIMTPKEALKDFFGMGLDVLVLEDIILRKADLK